MGCSSSKAQNNTLKPVEQTGPLTETEIEARISAPTETQSINISGVSMRYAWVSQRGYYPDALNKDNQDQYSILPSFNPHEDSVQQAFFGVFDGHGRYGTPCAQYAKTYLPKNMKELLPKPINSTTESKDIKEAIISAHVKTNETMHLDRRFDDALSGTTAISIYFHERTMFISNVGDSRAIIVSVNKEGRLLAKPLSNDQTPYRKDERERIKKTGARILSMDQIEGIEPVHENWGDLNLGEDIDEGGDPPRVWSPKGDYPGTAFSRSLGDRVAKECGVIAVPEILERNISRKDKYIVLASDGVFEFLTNQMVADELMRHSDPLMACKAVVAAAYNMWLQYEVRTDDITIVAFYIDHVAPLDHEDMSVVSESDLVHIVSETTTPVQLNDVDVIIAEARPVRRTISREKRKQIIESHDATVHIDEKDLTEEEMKLLMVPKSQEDKDMILKAIQSNFLFQHLNEVQCNSVVDLMVEIHVNAGDRVIKQGDQGDRFYLVATGKLEVRVLLATDMRRPTLVLHSSSDKEAQEILEEGVVRPVEAVVSPIEYESNKESLGNVVHVYEANSTSHPGFGELSLMYGKPRAASVIALTEGRLWALDRRIFSSVVLRPKNIRRNIFRILKNIELLKYLDINQMQRLADLLSEVSYKTGQTIISDSTKNTMFYLILSGECKCTILNENKVYILKESDYFAEHALLDHALQSHIHEELVKYNSNNNNNSNSSSSYNPNMIVTCERDTELLYITREEFEEVFGTLAEIILTKITNANNNQPMQKIKSEHDIITETKFSDIKINGMISSDSLGPLLLGCFGTIDDLTSNISIRSFILSEVEMKSLKEQVKRFSDSCKMLIEYSVDCRLIPTPMCFIQDPNAIHMVFNAPAVSDLNGIISRISCNNMESFSIDKKNIHFEYIRFVIASAICALETLHNVGIIYRAIHPESIYIDTLGRVCLLDYSVSKVGIFSGLKTFTICGVSDYLSPEQIAQVGHSSPVDLWGLGVLLYEIAVGTHPFSTFSEVATYSKISSFGTKSFPSLNFQEHANNNIPTDCEAFIKALVVAAPEGRIGVNSITPKSPNRKSNEQKQFNSIQFTTIKEHDYFKSYSTDTWKAILSGTYPSPLIKIAEDELHDIKQEIVSETIFTSFNKIYKGSSLTNEWINELKF